MDLIGFHKKLEKNIETQKCASNVIKKIDFSSGYKQLCRFCLEEACKKIDENDLKLFKMLTNSTLVSAPEYPKSICSLCESQLRSAYKFRVSLLNMEECWSEFFRQDYRQFIESLDISEEHIYDEIFLEIEMDGRDDSTSSINRRSMDYRASAPLLDSRYRSVSTKSFVGPPRSIQALTISEKENREPTSTELQDQKQYSMYHQISHYTRIVQNKQTPSTEGTQSIELSNFSYQAGSMSEDKMSAMHLMERNHDTVSLSYERVNNCSSTENNLYEPKAKVSEANKIEIKCVVVGDAAVGKTNLISTYLKNKFDDQHIPTASDIYRFDVDVNDRTVRVVLCDTAGQDYLDDLRQLSYPGCHVFMLCFSVVKPESFDAIKSKWAPKFRYSNASLVVVGTQADLRYDLETIANLKKEGLWPVALSDARKLAKSIRAEYMETSSRNNEGVKSTFDAAIKNALKKIEADGYNEEPRCAGKVCCMCCVC